MSFAKALHIAGIKDRSVVLIQGVNTPEHLAAMAGTILSNCIFTDIYPTNSPDLCIYQAGFTQAKLIVCDTYKRFKEKFLDQKEFSKLNVTCAVLFNEGLLPQSSKYSYFNGDIKIYNWS